MNRRTHRAREILTAVGRRYPQAWQLVDRLRAERGRSLPAWPDWCFVPIAATYAVVSGAANRLPLQFAHHPAILAALAAWRVTQGIYRFDPDVYDAVCTTPLAQQLPIEPLYRLPEWCVYIETPGRELWGRQLHGVWAHLEYALDGADELRLVFDLAEDVHDPFGPNRGIVPMPLILGEGGIDDALLRAISSGQRLAEAHGYASPGPVSVHREWVERALWPIVSLVLYLCADDADLPPRPARPQPKRTRKGWRLFPADAPKVWDVGVRIGAALRRAYEAERPNSESMPTGRHVRPHVRRAHWHTFLAGPGRTERRVKWLPPIPVNVSNVSQLPSTIREVK